MLKRIFSLIVPLAILASSYTTADFVDENNLVINGIAVHEELRQPVFIATLLTKHPVNTPNEAVSMSEPARMELSVLKRSWSGRQFRQYWLSGIAINNAPSVMAEHQDSLVEFATILQGRLRTNDKFTLDFVPNDAILISVNGVEIHQMPANVWPLLVANWVGPRVDQDFRNAILTLPTNAQELLSQASAKPSSERIDAIEAWVAEAQEVVAVIEPTPVAAPAPQVEVNTGPTPEEIAAQERRRAAQLERERQARLERQRAEEQAAKEARIAFAEAMYKNQLISFTNQNVRYPQRAASRNQEGRVIVQVKLDRAGNVLESEVIQSSGHSLLDRESLRAVERASPYPAIPGVIESATHTAEIPLTFVLQ